MKLKRFIAVIVLLALSVTLLASCTGGGDTETRTVFYTVSFNTNCGVKIESKQIAAHQKLGRPDTPEKEGYIFGGWYYNGKEWDFSYNTVKEDMTLEAMWLTPDSVFTHRPAGDGTTVITGFKKEVMDYTIPPSMGGYTVTAIADSAFDIEKVAFMSEVEITITIPDTVKTVGHRAFAGCSGIEIIVEGKLLSIGEEAFKSCDGLKHIAFEEGMEKIPFESFVGCSSLKSVRIPKSVKVIEETAFSSCSSLQSVMLYTDLEYVENMAFDDTNIKALYVYGADAEIDALLESKVDDYNDSFVEAKVLIYSESQPEGNTAYDGFWYLDENDQVKEWK